MSEKKPKAGRVAGRRHRVSRPRLTDEQKITLLCVLIRNQEMFDQAVSSLTVEHWADALPDSSAYAVIWRVVTEFFVENNCLPARELIELRVQAMLEESPEILSDDEINDAEEFLAEAFESCELDVHAQSTVKWAETSLRNLLSESLADRAAALIRAGDDAVAADLPSLLDSLAQEAHNVSTIGVTGLGGPLFGEGWDSEEAAAVTPSGIDLIDAFTEGEVAGEVTLIAGPYGSCKSLLAVHSCLCAARLHRLRWRKHLDECEATGEKPSMRRPVAVYVSYEMPRKEFRRRLLANAASIPYSRLTRMTQLSELRGDDQPLRRYEEKLFHAKIVAGRPVLSERARVEAAAELIDQHIMFIDMTGKQKGLEHYGQAGIVELKGVLHALFPPTGSRWPAVMWVDHTAEMADEQALSIGMDEKAKIMLLRMVPKQLSQLGAHYGMPVYQIHQLSGEANSKGSSARLSLTELEGCRSLARSVDFVLLINKPTADNRAIISCDKHRRCMPKMLERVIRINGAYMRVGLDDNYTIEGSSRTIMPKSVAAGVSRPNRPKADINTEEGVLG